MVVIFTSGYICVPQSALLQHEPSLSFYTHSTRRQAGFVWSWRVTCLVVTLCIAVIVPILYVLVHRHIYFAQWDHPNGCIVVALFDVCLCTCICCDCKAWKHCQSLMWAFWFLSCVSHLSPLTGPRVSHSTCCSFDLLDPLFFLCGLVSARVGSWPTVRSFWMWRIWCGCGSRTGSACTRTSRSSTGDWCWRAWSKPKTPPRVKTQSKTVRASSDDEEKRSFDGIWANKPLNTFFYL